MKVHFAIADESPRGRGGRPRTPWSATEGERERGCGRPVTNSTTHGTNLSAAAESGLPEGAYSRHSAELSRSLGRGLTARPPRSFRGNIRGTACSGCGTLLAYPPNQEEL